MRRWTGRPPCRSWPRSTASGCPEYVIDDEGPDHAKTFTARVRVGNQIYGNGIGHSKKEAEQAAAETAYGEIALAHGDDPAPDAIVDAAEVAAHDSARPR